MTLLVLVIDISFFSVVEHEHDYDYEEMMVIVACQLEGE